MLKSVTTWSLRQLLVATISVAVVALPVFSVCANARIPASPLTVDEGPTVGEETGHNFDKIDLFTCSEPSLFLAQFVCVVFSDDSPDDRDAEFLIGRLERGPPVRTA